MMALVVLSDGKTTWGKVAEMDVYVWKKGFKKCIQKIRV